MYSDKIIELRAFEKEDIETYRSWINDHEIARMLDRNLPVSKIEHERWYADLMQNRNAVVFAVDLIKPMNGHKYIGNVWLWDINWRHHKAEIRIVIGNEDYCGKGLGVHALKIISSYAFKELNLNRIYAYVLRYNTRGIRAFEKSGFLMEGILEKDRFIDGRFNDVMLMAKLADNKFDKETSNGN